MPIFNVDLNKQIDDSYQIEIGFDLMDKFIEDLKSGLVKNINKYAIITDSIVEKLYGRTLLAKMQKAFDKVYLFAFTAGEKNKNRQTKMDLEDQLLDNGFGRDSCIIAIGGGAVSDLAGYLAGTFARGIPHINYSTTLLSAADASIGGKTGVNTKHATNLIGMFKQPERVYIDIDTWKTLPARQITSGLAETVKHACLADSEFFQYLEENLPKVVKKDNIIFDNEIWSHIAVKNCEIKYNVVIKDERENNLRQVLNLGHTLGRALETLYDYKLFHGETVSIGIYFQAFLGKKLGYVTEEELFRVKNLLLAAGLPVQVPEEVVSEELVTKMYTDKKVRKAMIRFVFQKGIGAMVTSETGAYSHPIDEKTLLETLIQMRG